MAELPDYVAAGPANFVPQSATPTPDAGSNLQALISQAGKAAAGSVPTAPAAITGHEAPALHLQQPYQAAMRPEHQAPLTMYPADVKHARRENALSSITNMINGYANRKRQDNFAGLTADIETIMKSQQQIDNANVVLTNDPNNAQAKQVIEQNKRVIDAKFANKTLSTKLQKAFDISFTDPEKNNTDEVKAGQAAIKNVQAATKAGVDVNTPAEKAIAAQANAPKAAQPAQAVAPKSATPYADQFLNKLPATIQQNPLYAQQVAAQQKQQQLFTQYVYPKIMTEIAGIEKAKITADSTMQRQIQRGVDDYNKEVATATGRLAVANVAAKASIQRQGMADATRIATANIRANALITPDERLAKNKALLDKLGGAEIQNVTKQINDTTAKTVSAKNTIAKLKDQQLTGDPGGKLQQQIDGLAATITANDAFSKQMGLVRDKLLAKQYGGTTSGDNKPSTGPSKPDVKVVGDEDDAADISEDEAIGAIDITKE